VTARRAKRAPGPEGFTWRGIAFSPPDASEPRGFYKGATRELGDRSAEWKVHQPKTVWHARLRIGADRYPGVGSTREAALDDAAREAANVAALIVTMLPRARGARTPVRKRTPRPRKATRKAAR
jgi:hypothetical protein